MPSASVARAWKVVVPSASGPTGTPPAAKSAALALPDEGPLQSAVGYTVTVVPAGAVPRMLGDATLAGDAGAVPVTCGAAGGALTWTVTVRGTESPLPERP